MEKQKDILDFDEFIDFASISKSRGYKALHNKELPYYKPFSGKVYFKIEDVRAWLLTGRISSKKELEAKAESLMKKA